MNTDIKQRWITALESGLYPQTKNVLHNDEGFCCLGVLCDLYLKEKKKGWLHLAHKECYTLPYSNSEFEVLPSQVVEWAGLDQDFTDNSSQCPWIPSDRPSGTRELTLSELNDDGHSFHEIAKVIKENF